LARYHNLNKWQLMMNNPELTASQQSDASKHGIGYCTASTLMGVPQFWSMPHMMSPATKAEFTKTLAIYKPHQKQIFQGYVFPIGDCPNNASWTGFQSIDDASAKSGCLMVFREINNPDKSREIRLRFAKTYADKKVEITDQRKGIKFIVPVSPDGSVMLKIDTPADYLFLSYRLAP
jgi:hypothetical protein